MSARSFLSLPRPKLAGHHPVASGEWNGDLEAELRHPRVVLQVVLAELRLGVRADLVDAASPGSHVVTIEKGRIGVWGNDHPCLVV